ncbi:MAG: WecB/TagA/CpsF family glycosyltransferase [Rhodanobacteraceae bacterium]|nr:WecB/TagA/CpsF family glycosyltransferase [Rhodanobacteraceae bacterium]
MNLPSSASAEQRIRKNVIGVPIDVISWNRCQRLLTGWAAARESRYVCICNVHSVVTANNDVAFKKIITDSDLATSDGFPIAWTLRRKGFAGQERINGPDLMWRLCADAQALSIPIGLFGSSAATLQMLVKSLLLAYPQLQISYSVSPPFRALTVNEDIAVCDAINSSGVGLLFVSLGCPKQEHWIAAHRGRISAVMVGVGAAFDYHAGSISRAPEWMRSNGFEWLFRLAVEPRRLWRRYLATNSLFLWRSVIDFFKGGFRVS